MPKCKHVVHAMLRILDHIRRELRGGMKCSAIMMFIDEKLSEHLPCSDCVVVMSAFRSEFVPLTDTVLPGDAHEYHTTIARRHGIKPTDF